MDTPEVRGPVTRKMGRRADGWNMEPPALGVRTWGLEARWRLPGGCKEGRWPTGEGTHADLLGDTEAAHTGRGQRRTPPSRSGEGEDLQAHLHLSHAAQPTSSGEGSTKAAGSMNVPRPSCVLVVNKDAALSSSVPFVPSTVLHVDPYNQSWGLPHPPMSTMNPRQFPSPTVSTTNPGGLPHPPMSTTNPGWLPSPTVSTTKPGGSHTPVSKRGDQDSRKLRDHSESSRSGRGGLRPPPQGCPPKI